jgi:hypothetical protein
MVRKSKVVKKQEYSDSDETGSDNDQHEQVETKEETPKKKAPKKKAPKKKAPKKKVPKENEPKKPKTPWMIHMSEFRAENPEMAYKEALKAASITYKAKKANAIAVTEPITDVADSDDEEDQM